jgi:hypothetical protein
MTRIYNNIFHSKVLQNVPKMGIFGLKRNHLATLTERVRQEIENVFLGKLAVDETCCSARKKCPPNFMPMLAELT